MTTIYLASRFSHRFDLRYRRKQLESMGYDVKASWINVEKRDSDEMDDIPDYANKWGEIDRKEVKECDIFILDTTGEDKAKFASRGGMHTEFGIAMGIGGKDLVIIGKKMNVFHFLSGVDQYDSWDEFLADDLFHKDALGR